MFSFWLLRLPINFFLKSVKMNCNKIHSLDGSRATCCVSEAAYWQLENPVEI